MQYKTVKGPRWANAEQTQIAVKVKFVSDDEHFKKQVTFIADKNDTEVHGREIFDKAVAGEYGEIKPFVVDTDALKAHIEKIKRDKLQQIHALMIGFEYAEKTDQLTEQEQKRLDFLRKKALELSRIESQDGYPEQIVWPEF